MDDDINLKYPYPPEIAERLENCLSFGNTGIVEIVPPGNQRMTWCYEAAEAAALLHSHGIIHADIKPANMVLDDNLGLRIIDFSGCAIDNSKPLCFESARYFLPRDINVHPCSVQTDLFALGSSLFEIITGSPPYSHLDENDIEEKYREGDFPSIKGLIYGSIIEACWKQEFKSAEEVKRAIRDDHIPPTVPWQAPYFVRARE
ncbi:hypothetical protein ED733_008145 [Metarhizium rileyi]|uniref:Protein kinase domain-containing protein n=1 Tax=Metarhizium rileyi (strain RCEF 4871) TaxID=1649241 RepID=A0A5C6GNE6_METRR|nr:hypothetical protein ED733_008145 [Metarhizium rileyi]